LEGGPDVEKGGGLQERLSEKKRNKETRRGGGEHEFEKGAWV